jgi:hypothetical protein
MNKDEFIGFLQNTERLGIMSLDDLSGLVTEFPYCQSARILLTLNLYKEKNVRFDSELKSTAIYVSNRGLLRKHIDRLNISQEKVVLPDEEVIPKKQAVDKHKVSEQQEYSNTVQKDEPIQSIEDEAESIAEVKDIIDRHLSELEAENEKRKSPDKTVTERSKIVKPRSKLIDDFIKNEPSISRPKVEFYDPVNKAKESIVDHENIVSETLAGIFYDQGHLNKAIKIYQKLSLKYPKKSSYFAALIEKAEKELES